MHRIRYACQYQIFSPTAWFIEVLTNHNDIVTVICMVIYTFRGVVRKGGVQGGPNPLLEFFFKWKNNFSLKDFSEVFSEALIYSFIIYVPLKLTENSKT